MFLIVTFSRRGDNDDEGNEDDEEDDDDDDEDNINNRVTVSSSCIGGVLISTPVLSLSIVCTFDLRLFLLLTISALLPTLAFLFFIDLLFVTNFPFVGGFPAFPVLTHLAIVFGINWNALSLVASHVIKTIFLKCPIAIGTSFRNVLCLPFSIS